MRCDRRRTCRLVAMRSSAHDDGLLRCKKSIGGIMKLVRYGQPGREKPGIVDSAGKIRDLSKIVPDITGATLSPASLNKIRKTKIDKLPPVRGNPRIGPCVGNVRHFIAIGLN